MSRADRHGRASSIATNECQQDLQIGSYRQRSHRICTLLANKVLALPYNPPHLPDRYVIVFLHSFCLCLSLFSVRVCLIIQQEEWSQPPLTALLPSYHPTGWSRLSTLLGEKE